MTGFGGPLLLMVVLQVQGLTNVDFVSTTIGSYRYFTSSSTNLKLDQAGVYCQDNSGQLATLHTQQLFSCITALLAQHYPSQNTRFYVGAERDAVADVYWWSNGVEVQVGWAAGQPSDSHNKPNVQLDGPSAQYALYTTVSTGKQQALCQQSVAPPVDINTVCPLASTTVDPFTVTDVTTTGEQTPSVHTATATADVPTASETLSDVSLASHAPNLIDSTSDSFMAASASDRSTLSDALTESDSTPDVFTSHDVTTLADSTSNWTFKSTSQPTAKYTSAINIADVTASNGDVTSIGYGVTSTNNDVTNSDVLSSTALDVSDNTTIPTQQSTSLLTTISSTSSPQRLTSSSQSWTTSSEVTSASPSMCTCRCVSIPASYTNKSAAIEGELSRIQRELMVDRDNLSKTIRKLTSARDHRISSQTAGVIGVAVLTLLAACAVLSDLTHLAAFLGA